MPELKNSQETQKIRNQTSRVKVTVPDHVFLSLGFLAKVVKGLKNHKSKKTSRHDLGQWLDFCLFFSPRFFLGAVPGSSNQRHCKKT